MTKDEIKKGLECCCNNSDFKNACRNCSYLTCPGCNDTLCKDALNLITEYEQEIERLRTTLGQCNTELNSALESLKSQSREIGELKAKIKQAQIDILTELKKKYGFYICCSWCRATKLLGEIIDEFIDEIKNEQNTTTY